MAARRTSAAVGALVGGFDPEGSSGYCAGSDPDFGLGESGEVYIEPMSQPGSRASSPSAAAVSAPSAAAVGGVGSDEAGQLGRFRVLGVLGQGQHATVYRAYDSVLDRDVALKVPRPGVLRTEKALERFLGEARRRRGCGIRGSSRSTRRAAPAIGITSPWR